VSAAGALCSICASCQRSCSGELCKPLLGSPVLKPALLAGAPAATNTFFCDATSTTCYTLVTTMLSQTAGKARCSQLGGQLVAWTTPEKQFEAER
jgi:hypothetical protein